MKSPLCSVSTTCASESITAISRLPVRLQDRSKGVCARSLPHSSSAVYKAIRLRKIASACRHPLRPLQPTICCRDWSSQEPLPLEARERRGVIAGLVLVTTCDAAVALAPPARRRCDDRTGTRFNRLPSRTDIVLIAVIWRLRYKQGFRDVAAIRALSSGGISYFGKVQEWH